jgi:peptidoglycan hydrolase-like protein with peptidoglycan-binding domain
MSGLPSRDLAVMDPWESSYARSRARRQRAATRPRIGHKRRSTAVTTQNPSSLTELLSAAGGSEAALRDLTDTHIWELSLGRSRARRRAQELRFVPSGPRAKRISLGALVALAAAPSASMAESGAPTSAAAPAGPPTTTEHSIILSEGSEGRQVSLLQRALGDVKVDGAFGPETEAAVQKFQSDRGLTVDGVVGPQTSGALREQTTATATLASLDEPVPGESDTSGSSGSSTSGAGESSSAGTGEFPGGAVSESSSGAAGEAASQTSGGESSTGLTGGSPAAAAAAAVALTDGSSVQSQSAIDQTEGTTASEDGAAYGTEDITETATGGTSGEGAAGGEAASSTANQVATPTLGHTATVADTNGAGNNPESTAGTSTEDARQTTGAGSAAQAGGDPTETGSASGEAGGSTWDAVTRLQAALHLPVDGEFGPETEAAIRRLQARHGLTANGVVGPETWNAIGVSGEQTLTPPPSAVVQTPTQNPNTAPGNGGNAQPAANQGGGTAPAGQPAAQSEGGSEWDAVTRLQAALHLSVDGEFGPETEAAIRRLQARHGLTVDGVVGPETWSVLGVTGERTLTPPPSAVVEAGNDAVRDNGNGDGGAGNASSTAGGSGEAGGSSSSAGGGEGVVARVIAAANEIATRPYVYGGGHGSFESEGYDCSGSVSYALHGGGLLSSPEDSTALESYGEPGPGKYITIYANAEHAYMVIDGRRFDTVALAEDGTRWSSSPGDDGGDFVERHPAGL